MTDYIPHKDTDLVFWSENFVKKVDDYATTWEIPAAEVTALKAVQTAFANLVPQTEGALSDHVTVKRKNEAREVLVGKIRAMARFRLQNPVITDDERLLLGLHVHDTKPTPVPVPATRPEIAIRVVDFRRIAIHFHDMDSAHKARPYGVNGAVLYYDVLDAPPREPDELHHSGLATRTPHILEFTEEERGKTVYIALRWQNEKGQKGPWSEIESVLVP